MKVILAKKAGFCMGVRRAVEMVLDTLRTGQGEIATFGPLIHNPQVLKLLKKRKVTILKEIPEQPISATIVIRAHGVPPAQKDRLKAYSAQVVDATCPRVIKVQAIIRKYNRQGYSTVIVGDKQHAEVEGLIGYAEPRGMVVSNEEDVSRLIITPPYIIVSQTTQDDANFNRLSQLILTRFPGGQVFNTICDSTHKRQEEVKRLCTKVQAVVVVGGRNSANTKRLGEIAAGMQRPVFLVETEEDLDFAALTQFDCVGVTAGASTPTWLINRVVNAIESVRSRSEGRASQIFYKISRFLLETNIYVSVGGGLLTYASDLLQNLLPDPIHFVTAFGYLLAMHNVNRFNEQESEKFNDPIRARFYRTYRWPLLIMSVLALVGSLALNLYASGPRPFLILLIMSALGILYSVPLIPRSLRPIIRTRGLKEIPGSKTIFVATAWAVVVVLLPVWESGLEPSTSSLGVFLFILLLIYVRSALFDVFDVQGDRFVGKETLPVLIGEKKTLLLLHWLIGVLLLLLFLLPAVGWMSSLGRWLIPGVISLGILIFLYQKGRLRQGIKLEFAIETHYWMFAILSWVGSHITR